MYVQRTTRYGNRIEIMKYHTSRYGVKGEKRQPKRKTTAEAVRKNNLRRMRKWLFMLLVENFTAGDHHIVLTYSDEQMPDPEQAKRNLAKFFRQMRRTYRKRGAELRWICTTEISKKGRIHHHVVMNDCEGLSKMLTEFWSYGGKHTTPLYKGGDYQGLADYLVKETKETFDDPDSCFRKRYSCSRNLRKPEVKTEIIKASDWRKWPRLSKKQMAAGYRIDEDSIVTGTDIFGYAYQKYVIEREDSGEESVRKKKNEKGKKVS